MCKNAQHEKDNGCGNDDRLFHSHQISSKMAISCASGEGRLRPLLLLHTEVGWLSRGKFLQRFRELYLGIKEFFCVAKHAE